MNKWILWLLVAGAVIGVAAGVKVSELPTASSVALTDVVPVVVGSQTRKATVAQLADAVVARSNAFHGSFTGDGRALTNLPEQATATSAVNATNLFGAGFGSFIGSNSLASPYVFQAFNGLATKEGTNYCPEGYYEPWSPPESAGFPANTYRGLRCPGGRCLDNFWVMYSNPSNYLTWVTMPFGTGNFTNFPKIHFATQTLPGGTQPDSFPWALDEDGWELPDPNPPQLMQGAAIELVNKRLLVTDAGMRVDKNLVVHGRALFDRERNDVMHAIAPTLRVMGMLEADEVTATSFIGDGSSLTNLRLTNGSGQFFTLGVDVATNLTLLPTE